MESMNTTPKADRIHIGVFGRRNAGKSSIINKITNQEVSTVSDVKGTTTDTVEKAMELLPLGPVVFIDTPGIDDVGTLGEKRVENAYRAMKKCDIAIVVCDIKDGITKDDEKVIKELKTLNIPYIIAYNKKDLYEKQEYKENEIAVSGKTGENIEKLKNLLKTIVPDKDEEKPLVSDLVEEGDVVLLVVPIDESAPKGRLILPQQQTIRELLDNGAAAIVVKDTELERVLASLKNVPKLVITDSQVFDKVDKILPKDVPLTSFSILFARYKGDIKQLTESIPIIKSLKDGDKILIAEGCTHHRQCNDIGTVKIPRMLEKHTQKKFIFDHVQGKDFKKDLNEYKLIIHCGACMLNNKEMSYRLNEAKKQGVGIVNYGVLLAHMNSILERAVSPLLNNDKNKK